jgi:transcriptional regulator with XRE-family HTH domain
VQAVVLRGIDRIHGDIRRALLDRRTPLTGPEICFLRKYNRWPQAEMAARLGVHKITVAKWESGALTVSAANQQRLRLLFSELDTFQKLQVEAPRKSRRPSPIRLPYRRGGVREDRAAVA